MPQHALRHQNKQRTLKTTGPGVSPETTDLVMLVRPRKSRIYFLRRFFDYPIKLTGGHTGQTRPGPHHEDRRQLPDGQALSAQGRRSRWKTS